MQDNTGKIDPLKIRVSITNAVFSIFLLNGEYISHLFVSTNYVLPTQQD